MDIIGWVYIIDSKAMPDILKIGFSTKDPSLRALELAGTSSPHPFRVVFDVLVKNPRSVEQAAHVQLTNAREGKEWFRCSYAEAINAIRACAPEILHERNLLPDEELPPLPDELPSLPDELPSLQTSRLLSAFNKDRLEGSRYELKLLRGLAGKKLGYKFRTPNDVLAAAVGSAPTSGQVMVEALFRYMRKHHSQDPVSLEINRTDGIGFDDRRVELNKIIAFVDKNSTILKGIILNQPD